MIIQVRQLLFQKVGGTQTMTAVNIFSNMKTGNFQTFYRKLFT